MLADVREECEAFGSVLSVTVPTLDLNEFGRGECDTSLSYSKVGATDHRDAAAEGEMGKDREHGTLTDDLGEGIANGTREGNTASQCSNLIIIGRGRVFVEMSSDSGARTAIMALKGAHMFSTHTYVICS